jgi:hypothetical protein
MRGRTVRCGRCGQVRVLCAPCYRGQVYCSAECAELMRVEKERAYDAKYRATRRGRMLRAERNRALRERKKEAAFRDRSSSSAPPDSEPSAPNDDEFVHEESLHGIDLAGSVPELAHHTHPGDARAGRDNLESTPLAASSEPSRRGGAARGDRTLGGRTRARCARCGRRESIPSTSTSLYRDTFALFGEQTPLYGLEWVPRARAVRRRRDGLTGLGDFADLERLLARTVAR